MQRLVHTFSLPGKKNYPLYNQQNKFDKYDYRQRDSAPTHKRIHRIDYCVEADEAYRIGNQETPEYDKRAVLFFGERAELF